MVLTGALQDHVLHYGSNRAAGSPPAWKDHNGWMTQTIICPQFIDVMLLKLTLGEPSYKIPQHTLGGYLLFTLSGSWDSTSARMILLYNRMS